MPFTSPIRVPARTVNPDFVIETVTYEILRIVRLHSSSPIKMMPLFTVQNDNPPFPETIEVP